MSAIAAWISNIILVILFALILELILPNSSMQRYVKLVIGLMLLMIMLEPLLSVFQIDTEEWLEKNLLWETEMTMSQLNSLEFQKKDIQLDNLAYISEYMAEQLSKEASAHLEEKYEVMLEDIKVEFKEYKDIREYETEADLLKNLSHIDVFLQRISEGVEENNIALVVIDPIEIKRKEDLQLDSEDDSLQREITECLSELWIIPEEKIGLQIKGGEK